MLLNVELASLTSPNEAASIGEGSEAAGESLLKSIHQEVTSGYPFTGVEKTR
jgi:hypothetical protein